MEQFDDEFRIGQYVDLILSFGPDGETPEDFLPAGKVIKRHYDQEDSDPCSYDLEFTISIDYEKKTRKTTRIYNVDAQLCWTRDKDNPLKSAGTLVREAAFFDEKRKLDQAYKSEYKPINDTRTERQRVIDEMINSIDSTESGDDIVRTLIALRNGD